MIFEIKSGKAKRINTKNFKNELELHQLIDRNLEELFEIRYIKDEHVTEKHGRIETLALDNSNRPVVIEYKKTMEKGQLAQANRYRMWIKQHPGDFERLVRKNLKTEDEIDFSNPRIICFAQDYNIDDKCLAFELKAELWKYQYYENDTLVIVREEEPELLIKTKPKSINVGKSPTIRKEIKEIKTAKTVEEHLSSTTEEVKKIFNEFDEKLFDISSEIEKYTTKASILYKTSVNFLELQIQRNRLRLLLRTKDNKMNDPKHLTEEIPKSYGWGNLNRVVFIDTKDLNIKYTMDDVLELVMQAFKTTQ